MASVPISSPQFHANVADLYGDRNGTTAPHPTAPVLPADPIRSVYRAAVEQIATNAKAALPASAGRIDKAVQLVLAGDVELLPDGSARVASQSNGTTTYFTVNGSCSCADVSRAPNGWCKHRLAYGIRVRANHLASAMLETQAAASDQPLDDAPAPVEPPTPELTPDTALLTPYVVHIHGKPFVQYAGLLQLAHARGLRELSARFVSVTAELAVAESSAVFADGRVFCECGDASPGNVGPTIRPHFARMALTRAKARCLRDALGVHLCSLEELE